MRDTTGPGWRSVQAERCSGVCCSARQVVCQAERGAHEKQCRSPTDGIEEASAGYAGAQDMGGSLLSAAPPGAQPASVTLSAVLMSVTPSWEAL